MLMPAPRLARRTTLALAAVALTVVSLIAGPSAVARTDSLPIGGIYSMHRSGYAVVIDGWANDRDTTTPVVVHVRVDNARVANATANQPTPTHGHRGFSVTVPLTSGPHGVCVRAQDSPDSSQN